MGNSKETIKLRQRKMPSGNTSLYLDIYRNGKRVYEYLHLYLIPERNRKDKEENRKTLELANAIKAKRTVEFRNKSFGFGSEYHPETRVLDYFYNLCQRKMNPENSTWNWGDWWGAYQHLQKFCDPDTTFADITHDWVLRYRDYIADGKRLRGKKIVTPDGKIKYEYAELAQNTKSSYFGKFVTCINKALEEHIIHTSPLNGIERFKEEEIERVYLTLEEVRAMAATECNDTVLKRAFLFSCLTGLRRSDIMKMTWGEVTAQGDYMRIIFRQKKTRGQEYLDISPHAATYLGERQDDSELVFKGLSEYNLHYRLKKWAEKSGIKKHINFHTGRHTFAVLMLDLGAEIYTVQKLLGHRDIHTTQVYANIMDKKKQEAVMRIPDITFPDTDK